MERKAGVACKANPQIITLMQQMLQDILRVMEIAKKFGLEFLPTTTVSSLIVQLRMIEHCLAPPRTRRSRRRSVTAILLQLQFQLELLQVARANAVRNRTGTVIRICTAFFGFAPGTNCNPQRKFTLQGYDHY
jgi:hypothetical protein